MKLALLGISAMSLAAGLGGLIGFAAFRYVYGG